MQMISHGLVSATLFLCVGVIYDRMHTREIEFYGGLVQRMPLYATVFMILCLDQLDYLELVDLLENFGHSWRI